MKRFSWILPLLFFLPLFGCGSEKDVPEAMPHQNFAADSAEVQNSVFQASPTPIFYPLEDAPTLTLYYPLSTDSLPAGDQQLLSAWGKATGAVINATGIPADEYQANLNTYTSADEMPDLMLNVPSYLMTEEIDVLLELGVSAPETYDDYHDLLLAMKNTYQPAQPLRLPESGVTGYNNFCAGFGISLGSRSASHGFYQVDGTIHYGPLEGGFTQYLTLLHDWYQEGIITSKFLDFTDFDTNSYLIELSTGECGAFFLPASAYETLSGMCSFPIAPGMDPVQASGDITHLAPDCATVIWGQGYSVSTACDAPELAVMALDWLYTPEARVLSAYGTEGVSYEIAGNQPKLTALVQENPSLQLPNYAAMTLGSCISSEIVLLHSASNLMEVWNQQKDDAYMIPQGAQMTQEESEE